MIEDTLKKLVKEGIDRKALQAAVNYFTFKYREGDFGSYPKGLMLGLQAMDSWLYDKKEPFMHIEANQTYEELKEAITEGYYEELIDRYLLKNPHKTILTVKPVQGLTTRKDEALHDRLQAYKNTLSEEEVLAIVENTKALREYQETPDTKEALETIPLLKREDMKKEATPYINEERKRAGSTLLVHDIFTNGIAYIKLLFDLKQVPAELFPYVGILKSVLMGVNTEHYSYGELFNEVNCKTGGIDVQAGTYGNAKDLSKFLATLEIKTKVFYENRDEALDLIREILLTSDFTDDKRLKEIIAECRSRMQASMTGSGHTVAALRALSYFSPAAACAQQLSGMVQCRLLEDLDSSFEEKKESLKKNLKALIHYIFRPENLLIDYTGTEEGLAGIEEKIAEFRSALFTDEVSGTPYVPELSKKNEAFMTAGQVQYVCRAGNFLKKGLPYTGALKVLKVMMG